MPYIVPVGNLKQLVLGSESGLYETKLNGFYESEYLINVSSYELQVVEQRYSIDNLPNCNSINYGEIFQPGFNGLTNSFQGKIVPWGTQPSATIDLPEFQACSRIQVIQYQ